MRKKERERKDDEFFHYVLEHATELMLSINDEQAPYIIPLNFAFSKNNLIYFHCAQEGKKLDLIKKNNNVSFCAACDIGILKEKASTAYRSVCVQGKAQIIENNEEKEKALQLIAKKYQAHCTFPTPKALFEETAVVSVSIENITGKERVSK